jgi:microcystin degradation protein MlrC
LSALVGKRVAIGGFMHETNTFQPRLTTYADFAEAGDRTRLTRGRPMLECFAGMNTAIEGALGVLREARLTPVPLVWTSATPCGYVTRDAFERIAAMLIEDLRAALPVDAVYLSLHGAMVAEHVEDAEGELLQRVRAVVGPEVPVMASLDLHANTTPDMAKVSDGLVAYTTYPHIDMADTGAKAAKLLVEALRRGRMPAKAYRQLPYLIPLTWQCSTAEPSRGIYGAMAEMIRGEVASASFTPGFPAADIWHCGPAVFAYGWDERQVTRAADELYRLVMAAEPRYAGTLYSPTDGVREAMRRAQSASRPIILADTQDNPGAGGSSDTVGLLAALIRNAAEGAVLGVLHDAEAAMAAHRTGEGNAVTIGVGAKSAGSVEQPIVQRWIVDKLGDGVFTCEGPMARGWKLRLGPMALLRSGGVRAVVATRKMQALDQAPFRHLGVEPRRQKILALKSSVHFRADFEPIAADILVVESPGAMIVDPAKLPFRHLRPGIRMNPEGPLSPAPQRRLA